jgi:hypothetical protein
MTDTFVPKNHINYECYNCNYITANKKDYNKHILTSKHLILTKYLQNVPEIPTSIKQSKLFICDCNKVYKHRQSLYTHKQKCNQINENILLDASENDVSVLTNLVLELVKSNGELQKQMIEVCKNGTTNVINNSNINSNNKSFNLQLFLNETCKDAMNIMDFVDSIKIQLTDIESIGELGYVNGISKLIIKNLNALDEHMRPVHCSDLKRESLYVKDANVWEKEDSDNKKIKKAIKYIAHKNICALPIWKAKYPDYNNSESKRSDQYSSITMEAMGGQGDNDEEKANKIVKKIAKEVLITKNN